MAVVSTGGYAWLSRAVLLCACCLLVDGVWIEAKAWLAKGLIAAAWGVTSSRDERRAPWPWADTWPVAYLEVPRLGISRYILAGVSGRTLAFGPGWAMRTPPPGEAGSSLIAGHRDTHFRFLKDLRHGDRLVLETPNQRRVVYRVTASAIVHQDRNQLIADQQTQGVVLVTCYPFEALLPGGELRYVVWAEADSMERFGLESGLNQNIITSPNEADPHISSSRLPAPRLSG